MLRPTEITQLMQNGKLRLMDDPRTVNLANQLMISPDAYLSELFTYRVNEAVVESMLCNDEFRENYPPKNFVSVQPGMINCGTMATGDPILLGSDRLFCNMALFGRTGAGKTSWLYWIITQLLGAIDDES